MALAVTLDAVVAIGAAIALANGLPAILLPFAVILGVAPWAAVIDDAERPRGR